MMEYVPASQSGKVTVRVWYKSPKRKFFEFGHVSLQINDTKEGFDEQGAYISIYKKTSDEKGVYLRTLDSDQSIYEPDYSAVFYTLNIAAIYKCFVDSYEKFNKGEIYFSYLASSPTYGKHNTYNCCTFVKMLLSAGGIDQLLERRFSLNTNTLFGSVKRVMPGVVVFIAMGVFAYYGLGYRRRSVQRKAQKMALGGLSKALSIAEGSSTTDWAAKQISQHLGEGIKEINDLITVPFASLQSGVIGVATFLSLSLGSHVAKESVETITPENIETLVVRAIARERQALLKIESGDQSQTFRVK